MISALFWAPKRGQHSGTFSKQSEAGICELQSISTDQNSNGYINPANTNWFVNIKCLIASKTVNICNINAKREENNKVNQVPIQQAKQLIISLEQ